MSPELLQTKAAGAKAGDAKAAGVKAAGVKGGFENWFEKAIN